MTDLILVRLHPGQQVKSADFTAWLQGLQITAYDLTVKAPGRPVKIGTAKGLATPPVVLLGVLVTNTDKVDLTQTQIIQHWTYTSPVLQLESAATAVIVAKAPAGHPEYPTADSFDVQLVISRNGQAIPDSIVEYNVSLIQVSGSLPTTQENYFGNFGKDYVTFPYVTIPPLPPPGAAAPALSLDAKGTPPPFEALKKAIDGVLKDDPGGTSLVKYVKANGQLPLPQCQQIAAEIIWNRAYLPPPTEPDGYGLLYTSDPDSSLKVDTNNEDATRQKFEGQVASYHAANDALASRLAEYVHAAAAAVIGEQMTAHATSAGFPFPLITGQGAPVDTEVELTSIPSGVSFAVPAAYFYALATQLSHQITADQRYQLATLSEQDTTIQQLTAAVVAGVVKDHEGFLTLSGSATITVSQAGRRLSSLRAISGSLPPVDPNTHVTELVGDWLKYTGDTATIDASFWQGEVGASATAAHQADYLNLVFQVVSGEAADPTAFGNFLTAIQAAPLNIASVKDLAKTSDQAWHSFFLANPGLLPAFTAPGSLLERIAAFVRHMQKFFTTPIGPVLRSLQTPGEPNALGPPTGDVFRMFAHHYTAKSGGGTFTFGTSLGQNPTAVGEAVAATFPGDDDAQAWLTQALSTIEALYDLTVFATTNADASEKRFSLMEALYARGFTSLASVAALTAEDFQAALEGSVAYPFAGQIQTAAGGAAQPARHRHAGFQPVNPDGSLTNCIPPEHLSPLGPVSYATDLLHASAASTCEEPKHPKASKHKQIGTLLAPRRGPLGDLHATRANLETPLPAIDLVNESLEALTAAVSTGTGAAGGAVFDTGSAKLADLPLREAGEREGRGIDPAEAFAAIPEHSSPAAVDCPPAQTAAYAALRADFTSPVLPYDQPLDICRSYLCRMGATRFEAMRRFRKDIAEFVLDPEPTHEPAEFQRYRWRYPVGLDIALEYLGVSAEEFSLLYQQPVASEPGTGQLVLWQVYGFTAAETGDTSWTSVAASVPEFLRRTGLTYCELVDLQRSGFIPFEARTAPAPDGALPECEPCCLGNWTLVYPEDDLSADEDPTPALYRLIVFIRLWRRLRQRAWCELTFTQLTQVTNALTLFAGTPSNPVINGDFLRQLAALLMLRDDFGADPIRLLPLWVADPAPADWADAVALLLRGVARHAHEHYDCGEREPEFAKILASNLRPLSRLAGFDPDTANDTWHALPTHTLRFAEVLGKIYASDFTVGEILFLFTALDHLDGDDPFPLPDPNETVDDPLALPEAAPASGDGSHSLWALRRALLRAEADDDDAHSWSWHRIAATLRDEFGYLPSGGSDPLTDLGEHFFPATLERAGQTVTAQAREYRTQLSANDTSPLMWDAEAGPFRYDKAAEMLSARLPLRDAAVIDRLRELRPLKFAEQTAVEQLYFAPRATLVPFRMIFDNFGEAVDFLVQEDSEAERFAFFQRQFARFYARCLVIAEHLAAHVDATMRRSDTDGDDHEDDRREDDDGEHRRHRDRSRPCRRPAAWLVLRSLLADGNLATGPWEDNSGKRPAVTWPGPAGGAFAALLGLTGTGLLGEYATADLHPAWRELRGPLCAFGGERDENNSPVPTVVPSLGLKLTPKQLRLVGIRNGFAMRDSDGAPLGGAQPFTVRWTGVLLVERGGEYRFHAGAPGEAGPDFRAAEHNRWRVTLQRGQKTWVVLSHCHGEGGPPARSEPLRLGRGAYAISAEFTQREPDFDRPGDVCPTRTGFEVAYAGPDTRGRISAIPLHRLFRPFADATLADGIPLASVHGDHPSLSGSTGLSSADGFLAGQYAPDLRDIRRTYQRAFKALLLAERFGLSAHAVRDYRQSEFGYVLANSRQFEGTSYYRTGPTSFGTHGARFDLDFLPVSDAYPPPLTPPGPPTDERGYPSPKRQAALFDWWERLFDYCSLREQTEAARERPPWLLFAEVAEDQPDNPAELLRHLGIDLRFAPLVLTYFDVTEYPLGPLDLADERWATRTWRAAAWLRRLEEFFTPLDIGTARPDLWASDDPGAAVGSASLSGNANLTRFAQDGFLENGQPRRYAEIRGLNDGLRERARAALVAYLCAMDRIRLPWAHGEFVRQPGDLSDLLLQDVETKRCTRMSRIEDAVRAIQAFVQRARLDLEPSLVVTPTFARVWEQRFASLSAWQACRRREVYLENWIEWDDLHAARRIEAFRFLEDELQRSTLTVAVPGGDTWWPNWQPPAHPTLELLQDREPAGLVQMPLMATAEGLALEGAQHRAATPAWLAPVLNAAKGGTNDATKPTARRRARTDAPQRKAVALPTTGPGQAMAAAPGTSLPLWLQAAVTLGTQFVRVAAAGPPPACAHLTPWDPAAARGCCAECGDDDRPVVDEYYFWLADSQFFNDGDVTQEADAAGKGLKLPPGASSGWEDPCQLPRMLVWKPEPMVHLYWTRLRQDVFSPPRRSSEGLPVKNPPPAGQPQLVLAGRTADSLRFTVSNGEILPADCPTDPKKDPAPGFRYDLADDAAVPLPSVVPGKSMPPTPDYYGLPAYPYFAYVSPGAPVEPISPACVAATVAGTLRTHCQFEAALKWYEVAYSPLRSDNSWAQCDSGGKGRVTSGETTPGHDLPCCPDAPVAAAVARHRAILLDYLETLLQWGDATACRDSAETAQQARVIFEALGRGLGARPVTVLAQDDAGAPMSLSAFVPRPAPLNPRLVSLYERSADRLALVRDCLDGRRLRLETPRDDRPFWGDDPLRNGWREITGPCEGEPCHSEICLQDEDLCCCGPYRFAFWVRQALDLATEARGLGAELLAAYEKGDAEALAALRATHERQLAELMLAARQNGWREADWQVQALGMTKQGAQARLRYYKQLLAAGLNAGEMSYQALTGAAIADHASANTSEAIGQAMEYLPDIAFGVAGMGPYLANQMPIGTKLAGTFSTVARIINTEAEMASTNAGLNLTQAGWDRRTAEWQLQVETIGIEIDQIQRQILAAERHRDVTLRDLNDQQRQIEHSIEVQDFLRDKFTTTDLYLYLHQQTAALYRQMYDLALHAARRAQRAFNRERGYTARRFLPDPGWDDLREGLLAGERLQLALRQMECAYYDLNCREYELTKHLSLRLDFPLAFLHLQEHGWAEIEVPEWMFDLDYPGQYLRRIKNLTLTIPCVVGPYTGVHCRLTLLGSQTRVHPWLADPVGRCCDKQRERGCGGRCGDCREDCWRCGCGRDQPADGYLAMPSDPRIVREYAAADAIATSSGQNDGGLFELTIRDERYLPFEFAGAVSRWRIELPRENNFFDLDTVTDVVLHLNYTAREGGSELRRAASAEARRHLPGAGVRLFDVRHDLPDAWASLTHPGPGAREAALPLRLGRGHFPYLPCDREIRITRLDIFVEAEDPDCRDSYPLRFIAGHESAHGPAEECRCEGTYVRCVAADGCSVLYHGVLDRSFSVPDRGDPRHLGELLFPIADRRIRRLFLTCRYETLC